MDFTIKKYKLLLQGLLNKEYTFQTFEEFIKNPKKKVIILRHDVDLLPQNSLRFAKIQSKLGIKGTYYFRAMPKSWDENVIKEISLLGHEVGYHYENLTTCNGSLEKAISDFKKNLILLRRIVPVTTICMHGSPMSKFDSKDLWKKYDYGDYKIIGEPYFDIDFDKVLYLTDTGRRWDGYNVSVRDKVKTSFQQTYHSTDQIIGAINRKEFSNQVMFTFHPQRWHNNSFLSTKELIVQNVKNIFKFLLINLK